MTEPDDPRDAQIMELGRLLKEARATIDYMDDMVEGLNYELHMRDLRLKENDRWIAQLQQQIEELKQQTLPSSESSTPQLPPFVKLNVPARRHKKPGRRDGHEAALRKKPGKIDQHQPVPLGTDARHRPICPHCKCPLQRLRRRRRIVEDLVPSAVEVTCYHTQSGYCPHCRRTVESRAPEQPPAANIPHGQLGINALATAAILRVRHRLPFRQIAQVLMDLPALSISAGGIVKQIQRLARWLEQKYQELIRQMRASPHVHVDETGWRIDGKNFWLWAFTDPTFTLYHVDASRGGKVPLKLLGKAFDGTVVADFYSAYDGLAGPKQRCLTHLMREIKDLTAEDQTLADCPLLSKLLGWCKEALRLKKCWEQLPDAAYEMKASRLEDRLDKLMKIRAVHAESQRLGKRLTRYRPELTRFLWDKDLEGTNNAAERALRPAVVMRKITGGSRSEAGAAAWAKLASLLRTTDQKNLGVFEAAKKLIMDYWAQPAR
jgi:transposase